MTFLGVPLVIVFSILWYLPGIRVQGKNNAYHTKDYIKTALIYGVLYSCLLIIVTEVTWDIVVGKPKDASFGGKILSDFLRAALLEEFFKLTGFLLAKRKLKPQRKIDFIMIAGLMGLTYNIVEKAVLGSIIPMIFGVVFPLHILWQFNQGGHYYEYEKAKAEGNRKLARREWFMAICVPFLFHGLWDSAIDVIDLCINQEDPGIMQVCGYILILAVIAVAVIYAVKTMKKVIRTAKEDSAEAPAEQEQIPEDTD